MSKQRTDGPSAQALRDLARAMGKECRGDTAVLGRGFPALNHVLNDRKQRASLKGAGSLQALPALQALAEQQEGIDTVVLARALEYETQDAAPTALHAAWKMLRPDGRLVVCVPNEDLIADGSIVQRFTRRSLKKLLLTIDRPRLVTTQPLKWLLMTLDTNQPPSRSARERYGIMAALCRGRVMELGCGPGHLSAAIAARGLQVEGVDKNAGKIAKARELYPEVPFAQADILTLDRDALYDTVVLAEVLEHVPTELGEQMLARAWGLVKTGGRLVISVPNEDCIRHPNHLQVFDRATLGRLLRPMGQPTLVAEQPFKWLLMYVDRGSMPSKKRVER